MSRQGKSQGPTRLIPRGTDAAASGDHPEIITLLVKFGAEVNPMGKISVTASTSILKEVVCESCEHQYAYVHSEEASGSSPTILGAGKTAAEKAARTEAEQKLDSLLELPKAVPCPNCGHYQRAMIPAARDQHLDWLKSVGLLCFFLGFVACFLLLFPSAGYQGTINAGSPSRELAHFLSWAWPAALGSGIGGAGLLIIRKWIIGRIDPNAGNADQRILAAQRLVLSTEEYEELLQERDSQESSPEEATGSVD